MQPQSCRETLWLVKSASASFVLWTGPFACHSKTAPHSHLKLTAILLTCTRTPQTTSQRAEQAGAESQAPPRRGWQQVSVSSSCQSRNYRGNAVTAAARRTPSCCDTHPCGKASRRGRAPFSAPGLRQCITWHLRTQGTVESAQHPVPSCLPLLCVLLAEKHRSSTQPGRAAELPGCSTARWLGPALQEG